MKYISIFILIIDGILVLRKNRTPRYAKEKLSGDEMEIWRRTRFMAHLIIAVGFYAFTFSENLSFDVKTALTINIFGLFLISAGQIVSIRNNIQKIGKWSSTILTWILIVSITLDT